MSDSETEPECIAKSLQWDQPAFLTFINRTGYPVDIAWLDYHGKIVRYRKELASGGVCHQNTFFTHPWIAWHSRTLERALLGGQKVFHPQAWQGEQQRTVVFIDRPVKSLLQLSAQTVKYLVRGDVDELEIPRDLLGLLKKRRRIDFVDYVTSRRYVRANRPNP
ncbi:von Hippel-Lindau disease tumor suppressor-like [Elysia marginata]|uniref:von Hippel-Lindau disease tumor suppressor-like n=1 Tax=Elysia marginata TaxID=1093978 RepID=A0AAV4ID46_9GAST|nr:von Hippel-Lindau disease tumor suppressor-like [Elysia marginata]